jgi:hypothetical protein
MAFLDGIEGLQENQGQAGRASRGVKSPRKSWAFSLIVAGGNPELVDKGTSSVDGRGKSTCTLSQMLFLLQC